MKVRMQLFGKFEINFVLEKKITDFFVWFFLSKLLRHKFEAVWGKWEWSFLESFKWICSELNWPPTALKALQPLWTVWRKLQLHLVLSNLNVKWKIWISPPTPHLELHQYCPNLDFHFWIFSNILHGQQTADAWLAHCQIIKSYHNTCSRDLAGM